MCAQNTTQGPPPAENPNPSPGPSILTSGLPTLGDRSGQQLDFRIYGGVSGIFDNGIQPLATDAQGNLLHVSGIYGVEASLGAYGSHSWQHARLGLDYTGDYRHYENAQQYDGSDQLLALRYTLQKSQRLVFDFIGSAGTYARLFGETAIVGDAAGGIVSPATQLLDARTNFGQGTAAVTYIQSPRTSYTASGNAYISQQSSLGLPPIKGFGASGSVQHRLSLKTSIGAVYSFSEQRVASYSNQTNTNTFAGTFDQILGQHWTFSLQAGATIAEVNSLQPIAVDPILVLFFGFPPVVDLQIYAKHYFPSGTARLQKEFSHAVLTFGYDRATVGGSSYFLASRIEDANMAISYSGIQKWNFGLSGGWYSLHSLSQGSGDYAQYSGALGITYELFRAVHLSARYDFREQAVDPVFYRRTSSRVSLGLLFSPGTRPLSLW